MTVVPVAAVGAQLESGTGKFNPEAAFLLIRAPAAEAKNHNHNHNTTNAERN